MAFTGKCTSLTSFLRVAWLVHHDTVLLYCSLDHDDGSFMYKNSGNVVAFAGAKNYEG